MYNIAQKGCVREVTRALGLGFPQSSPVLSPPSPDLRLKAQSLLTVSPSVVFSLQSFQSLHKYLRITRVISLTKSWNRSVIWNFIVFGDTTVINLPIFYDARDDEELIGFFKLTESFTPYVSF